MIYDDITNDSIGGSSSRNIVVTLGGVHCSVSNVSITNFPLWFGEFCVNPHPQTSLT